MRQSEQIIIGFDYGLGWNVLLSSTACVKKWIQRDGFPKTEPSFSFTFILLWNFGGTLPLKPKVKMWFALCGHTH